MLSPSHLKPAQLSVPSTSFCISSHFHQLHATLRLLTQNTQAACIAHGLSTLLPLRGALWLQVYLVNPNKTDVLLLIGAIYYQLGNYEQCIAFNDRCILLDPHMAEAHANLANALQQLGNFDMAVIYYQVQDLNLLCCFYQLCCNVSRPYI